MFIAKWPHNFFLPKGFYPRIQISGHSRPPKMFAYIRPISGISCSNLIVMPLTVAEISKFRCFYFRSRFLERLILTFHKTQYTRSLGRSYVLCQNGDSGLSPTASEKACPPPPAVGELQKDLSGDRQIVA